MKTSYWCFTQRLKLLDNPPIFIQFYQIPCLYLGCGFSGSHRRLRKSSNTCFITGYIYLIKNKIWVFHLGGGGGGGICPILLHPNTRDLVLLLSYTTASLDFERCPISVLTTHSPRMVNNQHHAHAHTPDSTLCDHAYEMQSCNFMLCHATCNIYKFQIIIFPTYNFHSSQFPC